MLKYSLRNEHYAENNVKIFIKNKALFMNKNIKFMSTRLFDIIV